LKAHPCILPRAKGLLEIKLMTRPIDQNKVWSRSVFAGGAFQLFAVVLLILLPFLSKTIFCSLLGESYCQIQPVTSTTPGNPDPIVYIFLAIMAVLGLAVVSTSHSQNVARRCLVRWLAAIIYIFATCFTISFGPGLIFLPGTLLVLISALACRKDRLVVARR
jgi:hypothetical protein